MGIKVMTSVLTDLHFKIYVTIAKGELSPVFQYSFVSLSIPITKYAYMGFMLKTFEPKRKHLLIRYCFCS